MTAVTIDQPLVTRDTSKASRIVGWSITGVVGAFMLLDGVMKLMKPDFVVKATVELGYPESCIVGLGIVLTISTLLYLIPRTAVIGAILLTGYLGGAVATHVRVSAGAFPVAFAVVFGVLVWLGLFLRDARVRALVPVRHL